jgi:hypothetical protein
VTIGASDIVPPVFPTTEVIALLLARVAAKTRFGGFFRRLVFERNDFCGIAFGDVVLARTVTRLTTGDLAFPTANPGQLGVRCV